jgi:hypothetical protein
VDGGSTADVGYLEVLGETTISVDDIQRGRDDDHESVGAAIIAELTGGQRPSLDVKEAVAKRLSCSLRTVERHAVKMRGAGDLVIEKSGWPATSQWALTVATSPGTPNVATGVATVEPPINTGFRRTVATVATRAVCLSQLSALSGTATTQTTTSPRSNDSSRRPDAMADEQVRRTVIAAVESGDIRRGGPSELAAHDLLDDVPAGYWERWNAAAIERIRKQLVGPAS